MPAQHERMRVGPAIMRRAARLALLVAMALGAILPLAVSVAAQPNSSTVTDEFNARAAERARRGPQKSIDLPDLVQNAPSASGPLFRLSKVSLSGVRALTHKQLAPAYKGFVGRQVSQADLVKLTNAITEIYKDHGYALTRAIVPPQDVQRGQLTVQVLEGYVEDVVVEGLGADWFIAREIVEGIKRERPVRLATLERHMLLLSDLPGIRIADATLKELGTATGRFRLTIRAEFKRVIVGLDFDNRGSRDIGPWQSYSTILLNSAVRRGDVLALNVATVPNAPRELTYVGGLYEIPVGINGARLGVRGAYSTSDPSGVRATIDTHTTSHDVSIYGSVVPMRTRAVSVRLTASMGMREAEETNVWGVFYQDHVRAGALTADLQVQDSFKGANYLSLTYRGGIGAWGASDRDPMSSRPDAESDFHKAYIGYSRYQALAGPFSVLLAAAGQVTSAPMLKSEAFYVGGSAFGRAFAPGTIMGDSGLAGLAELRFDQTLERPFLQGYQLYAFMDAGALWTRGADFQRIASYGTGIRFRLEEDLRAGFEVAVPTDISTFAAIDRGTRFYFSLSRVFKGCEFFRCD